MSEQSEKNRHGPKFLQLSSSDQSMIMKIHKNAGHPGPDKLAYLLRQQGYSPMIVTAVQDLYCPSCEATKRPTLSRPASIHSPCDFNDIVSADG